MSAPDGESIPKLSIEQDPLSLLLKCLLQLGEKNRHLVQQVVCQVITEGHRYSRTPAGLRWRQALADSTLVKNGWLVWNFAGIDALLEGGSNGADSPFAFLERVLQSLSVEHIEDYISSWVNIVAQPHTEANVSIGV